MRWIQNSQFLWSYLCRVLTLFLWDVWRRAVNYSLVFALLTDFNCLQKPLFFHTPLKHYFLNLNLWMCWILNLNDWDFSILSCWWKKVWSNGHWFYIFILFPFCGASKHKNYLFQIDTQIEKLYPHHKDTLCYLLSPFTY